MGEALHACNNDRTCDKRGNLPKERHQTPAWCHISDEFRPTGPRASDPTAHDTYHGCAITALALMWDYHDPTMFRIYRLFIVV